jgi:hypothetical protein
MVIPLLFAGKRVSETAPTVPMQKARKQSPKKARRRMDLRNFEGFGCISFNISQFCIQAPRILQIF